MQEEFQPLVADATARCIAHFAHRFVAVYLHGSIHQGDAVPGVSDLDYCVVIADTPREADSQWLADTKAALQQKHPIVQGIHMDVRAIDALARDRFARFALQYNATCYAGRDIVAALPGAGYSPDKALAKSRLRFAEACFREALAGEQPACTGEIPENTYYAARKFARYFVVIEGAYFLMAQGTFDGFAKDDVLAGLRAASPGFEGILALARDVLENPVEAGVPHAVFLRSIRPFVEWMLAEIAKA